MTMARWTCRGDTGGWGRGPGTEFAVTDAAPGTRFLLMTGQPYGEVPVFNGPYVD
jgi:hypothetical protein